MKRSVDDLMLEALEVLLREVLRQPEERRVSRARVIKLLSDIVDKRFELEAERG